MACEMCGREAELYKAVIEGTELSVCEKCGKFGKVIKRVQEFNTFSAKKNIMKEPEVVEVLVADFPQKIKSAREKLGLTQKDFAKKINEKESILHKIETGHYKPPVEIAKRYEKVLNVKLVEKVTQDSAEQLPKSKSAGLTLGDFIKV